MADDKVKVEGAAAQESKRSVVACNSTNRTLEFCIRGRWIRWEPSGSDGSAQVISRAEAQDPEFKRLAREYFSVKEASK